MHTDDFDFALPQSLIAQHPPAKRGDSRLLSVSRNDGALADLQFAQFAQLLRAGDVLVLNASTVIPARLLGKKTTSGGGVELLLVRPFEDIVTAVALESAVDQHRWRVLGQASKPIRVGARLTFAEDLEAEVLDALGEGEFVVKFQSSLASLKVALSKCGQIPLPPYVTRAPTAEDEARYQTVFASRLGSVAAPTAGLHLTEVLLREIQSKGVEVHSLSLDIGPGTFRPVREGDIANHVMHEERFDIGAGLAQAIFQAKREARRVVAVGTTVVRALESAALPEGGVKASTGATSIFITPGYPFRIVDALLTNFHLPKSTLLMLVSAFCGRENTLAAYRHAVQSSYRFFSYGDAMFIA